MNPAKSTEEEHDYCNNNNIENEIEINYDPKKSEHTVVTLSPIKVMGEQKMVQSVIVIASHPTSKDKTAHRRPRRSAAVSPILFSKERSFKNERGRDRACRESRRSPTSRSSRRGGGSVESGRSARSLQEREHGENC